MEIIKITKAHNGYYQLSKPNVKELEVVAVDDLINELKEGIDNGEDLRIFINSLSNENKNKEVKNG